jgi:hypothetical protein
MKTLYLVIGSSGEWSDRIEWPVALYESEDMARKAAERSKFYATLHDAMLSSWRRNVLDPWYKENPPPRPGWPVGPELIAWNAAFPKEPEYSNPFDPERGDGDEYTVEPVPLLTELPADNGHEHEQPEQPRAQEQE